MQDSLNNAVKDFNPENIIFFDMISQMKEMIPLSILILERHATNV